MAKYTQAGRALSIQTALAADALLLEKLTGSEGISRLFRFELDLLAEQPVDFNQVLGQSATVTMALPNGTGRFFNGIIRRLTQGEWIVGPNGKATLLRYRAELVPALWLLKHRLQSRIFQNQSVADILEKVLKDDWALAVSFRLIGKYESRNYCVQYRESDFTFVSRLMEEEGIYYFFEHTDQRHTLVITDSPTMLQDVSRPASVNHDTSATGWKGEPRIHDWSKSQSVRASRHVVRDWSFQLPDNDLSAVAVATGSIAFGSVTHVLGQPSRVNDAQTLETIECPAAFGHRFDGINVEGAEQPQELQKIFDYPNRLAKVRQEQETARGLRVHGRGDAGHFVPGAKFTLAGHFDANGSYLLTKVEHQASIEGAYVGGRDVQAVYENQFECLPADLPYRPRRKTPRPRIDGSQTATVVGPKAADVHVDKYGRVKVQFHWGKGKAAALSSCWIRVAQFWAGKTWGAFFWPRVGHEVVVTFEEGDPERPLIVGSVYNADNMPPQVLPEFAYLGGIKSCSMGGTASSQSSALIFNDLTGVEHVRLHSERHDVCHTEGTRIDHVGGRHLRATGGLAPLGSGSGGGTSGSDILDVMADAIGTNQSFLPGSYECVFGNKYTGVIAGASMTTAIPAMVQFVVDLIGMAKSALNLGPWASKVVNLLGAVPGLGATGRLDVVFGKRRNITYGMLANFHRGQTYTYHGDTLGVAARLEMAMGVLAVLTSIAGDLILSELAKDAEQDPQSTRQASYVVELSMSHFMCSSLTTLLLNWMSMAATKQAIAEAAAKKAAEAERLAAQAVAAPLEVKPAVIDAAGGRADDAADEIEQALGGEGNSAMATQTYEGDYTVNAHSISLMSKTPVDPTEFGGCIYIESLGGLEPFCGGSVHIDATYGVRLAAGSSQALEIIMTSAEGVSNILIDNTAPAGITKIQNLDAAISLNPELGIKLQVSPTCSVLLNAVSGITMRFGEYLLTINEEGISQTVGTNEVTLGPAGMEIEADAMAMEIEGDWNLTATALTIEAETYDLDATDLMEAAATVSRDAAISTIE